MHRVFSILAIALVSQVALAENKGKPNTFERNDYCDRKQTECLGDARKRCEETYKDELARGNKSGFDRCLEYENDQCLKLYSRRHSDCRTAPRTLPGIETQGPARRLSGELSQAAARRAAMLQRLERQVDGRMQSADSNPGVPPARDPGQGAQPALEGSPRSPAVSGTRRKGSTASQTVMTPDTTTGTDGRFDRQAAPTVGYLTSEAFRSDMHAALVGTELQVSHTREGVVQYGPPIEVPSVPGYKAQDLLDKCDAGAARGRDPQECLDLAADIASRVRPLVPVFRSWVRFGSSLRKLRPDLDPIMPLRIPVLKSGKLSFFVNHLHTRVDVQHFQASIGDGTLNLAVTFDFADPAILCAGHGGSVRGLLLDAVCPDVDVRGARLDIRLVPTVDRGRLSYSDALVDFEANVELAGVRGDVASAFVNAEPILENGVESQLRRMLSDPAVRGALELALLGIVERRVGPLAGPLVEARAEGNRLLVRARSPSETIAR